MVIVHRMLSYHVEWWCSLTCSIHYTSLKRKGPIIYWSQYNRYIQVPAFSKHHEPSETILAVYSCSIDNRRYLQLPNHLFPRTVVHAGLYYTRSLLDQTIGMAHEPFNTLTTCQSLTQRYVTKTRSCSTLKQTAVLSTKFITDRSALRD